MFPTASQRAKERWLRAFAFGLLAEVATVAAIVTTVMAYRHLIRPGRSEAYYGLFSERAGLVSGFSAEPRSCFSLRGSSCGTSRRIASRTA